MSETTPATVRGIHIPATGEPIGWVDVRPDTLASWAPYIGDPDDEGYVEAVNLGRHGDALHLDEDGKRKGLPVNDRATVLGHAAGMSPGDVVVGDALILGYDAEGEAATASPVVTKSIRILLGEVI